MRIAIVINKSWNIYNFRLGLVKALQRKGHEIVAIAPEDEYSKLLEREGCEFIALKMDEKGSNPIKDLSLLFQLYKIYKKNSLNIILHYTIKPNLYGSLAARLLEIPTINNVSGLGTVFLHSNLTTRIAKTLYKLAFKFPKKIFFQNNDDLKLFLQEGLVRESKTGLLPGSGINLNAFRPAPFKRHSPFVFLVIARLLYDKGIVEFVEAAKILKGENINVAFQVLGYTDFNTKLGIAKPLLEEWIHSQTIEYLGTTDNVAQYISKADCVVLPSYREGTPRTLLEAASLGKPLIATNVPGCREVVHHEYNGYLCEVKSSKDLADRMRAMFCLNDNILIQFGKNSRRLVEEKFDEEIVFNKYLEAIDQNT